MNIFFLGTGSVSSLSNSASYLINKNILIDCGNGIYKVILNNKINIKNIEYILITHLHGDHIFDIPFLLFGIHQINPHQKLTFIGNKSLKRKVINLLKEAHPISYTKIYKDLNINFIRNENLKEFCINNIYISSFEVIHGKLPSCYGYKLNNVAFTGDTSYCNSIKAITKKVDYLIVDTTMVIGNNIHMGIDNIKNISNNNKNLKIITTHMGINSKFKLKKTLFKNNNVLISEDKLQIKINYL